MRGNARRIAVLLLASLLAACTAKQPPEIVAYTPPLPRDDAALLGDAKIDAGSLGYLLIDAKTGAVIEARQPDQAFIPASTVKILTAVAALGILGPDHRFETVLATNAADGTIPELQGDLYLIGGGDPLLAPADLMALAERLADTGVRSIAGAFHVDRSRFPATPRINARQPDDAIYNAGISALSLDFNRRRVFWRESDATTIDVWTSPPVGAAPLNVAAGRRIGQIWLPVAEPAEHGGAVFRALAGLNGVALPAPTIRAAPTSARRIAAIESEPLVDVARAALEHSNNVVAELIGLEAARGLGERPKSLADAATATTRALTAEIGGIDWSTARLPNHSGLSAMARLTPRQTVAVLRYADGQRMEGRRFRSLLPASGWREAFENRLSEPETAMRVWAKTGTMRYATGIAGYLIPQSGREAIFAIYVTDFENRAVYDALVHPRADGVEAAAEAWRRRAKTLEAEIIRRWALVH